MFVYIFQSQINIKKINSFLYGFIFLFFLSPILYSYESISKTDKRTDYPGKEIAAKVQIVWDQDFDKEIEFVTGNEWNAGNLSYHLRSRPKWEGFNNSEILKKSSPLNPIDSVSYIDEIVRIDAILEWIKSIDDWILFNLSPILDPIDIWYFL